MSYSKGYCILDDAHAFLTDAKGVPAIPAAALRLRRLLRACVMLSWVALEDGLDDAFDDWKMKGHAFTGLPTGLKKRIVFLLSAISGPPFNSAEFDYLREVRNCLAHPKVGRCDPPLTLEIAIRTFNFCLGTLRTLSPYRVVCPVDQSDILQGHELAVRIRETPHPKRSAAKKTP